MFFRLHDKDKFALRKNTKKALRRVKKDIESESKRTDTILGVTVPANNAEDRTVAELKALDRFAASSKSRGNHKVMR